MHMQVFNTLRPRQNGRDFADDIFKCTFLNENVWIPIKIAMKFVPRGPINNIPALVQIIAWRRPGDKPLSEPKMVSLTRHICVTRPQWVKLFLFTKVCYQVVKWYLDRSYYAVFYCGLALDKLTGRIHKGLWIHLITKYTAKCKTYIVHIMHLYHMALMKTNIRVWQGTTNSVLIP